MQREIRTAVLSFCDSDQTSDPYNMEEPDPAKSNALESSLWEIKALQQHYHHSLAKKANQVSNGMQSEETPLGELLETKTSDVSNRTGSFGSTSYFS